MTVKHPTLAQRLGAVAIAANLPAAPVQADSHFALFKPEDPQTIALGGTIYAEQCAACHGANLKGEDNWQQPKTDGRMPAPPHDETGHTWHHPDQQLFDITKYGIARLMGLKDYQTDMPVYQEILTDEEIIAVLSYIKAQWPPEIRKQHDEMNRRTAIEN